MICTEKFTNIYKKMPLVPFDIVYIAYENLICSLCRFSEQNKVSEVEHHAERCRRWHVEYVNR